jgi:hypothetical protein
MQTAEAAVPRRGIPCLKRRARKNDAAQAITSTTKRLSGNKK